MHPSRSPSGSNDEGRFLPGLMIAGRYRIVSLLGRGGMDEVYRATDIKLGQPVALKFLPADVALDAGRLARFHNEVRTAREVAHPNVCRVYDIGEAEGLHYISMQYVDGEDLASLLRRIGRPQGDKAVEIARELCTGLAAAHDRRVLHRDLKPANVMIDGRGQVLIMDFGLAGLAGQIGGAEIGNGTPGYMAPEQLAGKEVSTKSDIYALGLVLYEIFTGKKAFVADSREELARLKESGRLTEPDSIAKDIDPAVDRIIRRCLEPDPRNRPSSALSVAAALPGGDLLAAALAAGETPSPEMVAAAGETEGLRISIAVMCLIVVFAGIFACAFMAPKVTALGQTRLENPEVLAHQSREILSRLGYDKTPVFTAYGFQDDLTIYRAYTQKKSRSELMAPGGHRLISFWYRESPRDLISTYPPFFLNPTSSAVTADDPPLDLPRMARVQLDPQGRLARLEIVPPFNEPRASANETVPWDTLLSAAGVDMARLKEVEPGSAPPVAFNSRVAWTGAYPGQPSESLRIEAAARNGIPVFFGVLQPWFGAAAQPASTLLSVFSVASALFVALLLVVVCGAVVLARHNIRVGRGDRRGAYRLAAFVFAMGLLGWVVGPGHLTSRLELVRFYQAICAALFGAGLLWVMYIALEPYARKGWPQALISWNRILAGKLRDPRVGGDVLIGAATGVGCAVLLYAGFVANGGFFQETTLLENVLGARHFAGRVLADGILELFFVLFVLLGLFLLCKLLRRQWLAAAVLVALYAALMSGMGRLPEIDALFGAAVASLFTFVVIRFGFLSAVVATVVIDALTLSPVTTDFSIWYADAGAAAMLLVGAMAVYGFHTTLAGRALWKDQIQKLP